MPLCNVTVKVKTSMKFCLLTTYNVKGRVAGKRIQSGNLKDLGVGPGSGSDVAPSPLQLLTGNLSEHRFPLCDLPQRFEAGIKETHAKAPQTLAS